MTLLSWAKFEEKNITHVFDYYLLLCVIINLSACYKKFLHISDVERAYSKWDLETNTPEHFAPKNIRNLKTRLTHWSPLDQCLKWEFLWWKVVPFSLIIRPPDSAPVRKMANKEYFILWYFQRIRKLHYLLLHSFTGVEYIFFRAISNAKIVFIEIPPIYKRIHTFLTFCCIECSFKWWALPKKFLRSLFLPKSSTTSPNSAVVHRSLARQLSIPRDTLTTKPSSRASSLSTQIKKKLVAFRPRTTFSSKSALKSLRTDQCKSTIEC